MEQSNDLLQPIMHEWLMRFKKETVLQRTFEKLMSLSKHYVFPSLGQKEIKEIDSDLMQSFLSEILNKSNKLSSATAKKCKYLMNDFFEFCCENGLTTSNPIKSISVKQNTETKKTVLKGIATQHRQSFIDAVSSHRFWKPFCLTILYTGMKIGEILPLKWQDINFEKKTVTIKNAIAATIQFDDNGNVLKRKNYISPTMINREILLSEKALHIINEYRRFREKEQRQQRNFSYIGANDLVFGNERSELRSYSGISHLLERFLQSKGLEDLNITFSTIRHTFTDLLREVQNRQQPLVNNNPALAKQNMQKAAAIAQYKKTKNKDLEMT